MPWRRHQARNEASAARLRSRVDMARSTSSSSTVRMTSGVTDNQVAGVTADQSSEIAGVGAAGCCAATGAVEVVEELVDCISHRDRPGQLLR